MTDPAALEAKAEAALRHAAKLIERGRRATAEGRKAELRPIEPAVAELCHIIRDMPAELARSWVERLNVVLRDLHAFGAELAAREALDAEQAGGTGRPLAKDEPAPGEGGGR